ncbi:polyphosphate--glucose phosphotransferase [Tolumonas lignilytica]|jgi:Transcriptional regulator/sugar kinase|uniref:polyphosphate--glucose phosphotransferase n=1 Tax=Tolumonas lignilytica TaxID=1283284 RepID=UPI00046589E4|nr:ROK family protein [Tolumonas lignilytica]
MQILGVDIGGTGIKAAVVDTQNGTLISEHKRVATPRPATPENIANTLKHLVAELAWTGPIGCGFPATVQHGIAYSASNIDPSWINTDAQTLFTETTGQPCFVVNDADAAGMAEMRFGTGQNQQGVTILLTIGTGIGSAVFVNGELHPNTELGHLKFAGDIAERYCAESTRITQRLDWATWGHRFNDYLNHLEFIFNPDRFIIGGGVAEQMAQFAPFLTTKAPVLAAKSLNQAGIIGAALFAESKQR